MTSPSATADWYARAAVELGATSELQVEWAHRVVSDAGLLALIDGLPREHRQPSLLFAAAAWWGAPPVAYPEWRAWVVAHWDSIGPTAAKRRTQTNEVGRCIPLLVGLSQFDGPIALLELGASAGLCLALDRYSYRFDDGPVLGAGSPLLTSSVSGTPVVKDGAWNPEHADTPTRMPEIVWRAGVDLAPLDVRNADDVRWLEALLPPDRPTRLARLRQAIETVREEPPGVVAGDALEALAGLAAEARAASPDATLIVASLGTLVYLPPADRLALPDAVAGLGAHLVAFEAGAAVPGVPERLAGLRAPEPSPFVLSVDGEPLANAAAHGDHLSWLAPALPARHPELPGPAT